VSTWSWRQVSGPAVALSSTSVAQPTFTVPSILGGTTLVFGLTVTDNNGNTSVEDTVTITALTPTVLYARGGVWTG
jgi:hypothetical protein